MRNDHSLNHNFKNEFEIFYSELKEFFNAEGLDQIMEKIKHCGISGVDSFLQTKREGWDVMQMII